VNENVIRIKCREKTDWGNTMTEKKSKKSQKGRIVKPPERRPNIEELKENRDIDGLIQAMKYEDQDVRMYASIALFNLGEDVLEPCLKALKDKDPHLRWGLIWVLSKLGKPALEPLKKIVSESKDEEEREAAQMALDMMYEEGKIFFE
jgi:HEAT repeat protein